MNTKRCVKCNGEKALKLFYRDKTKKDGHSSECKECDNKRFQEYRQKHKKKIAVRRRKYRKRNKEKICNDYQAYYKENKEAILKNHHNYRLTENGKLASARARHNRRTHLKTAIANLTIDQWDKILTMQNNRCNICGRKFIKKRLPTTDHIIPLSRGGNLTFENTQALCGSCNSRKHAKLDPQFIQTWIYIISLNTLKNNGI